MMLGEQNCDFCGGQRTKLHLTYDNGVLRLCDGCWKAYGKISDLPEARRQAFVLGLLKHQMNHGGQFYSCNQCQDVSAVLRKRRS